MDDSTKLAGLVLRVEGHDFNAEDFRPGDLGGAPKVSLEVPNGGQLAIRVELRQGGSIVGEGTVSWGLRKEYEWTLDVFRQVSDPTEMCFGCMGRERIDIAESAQAQEGESLWLTWGGRPRGSDIVY